MQVLEGLVAHVVQHQGALHRLMDALALLDLLTGFAKFVTASPNTYTRPSISETGEYSSETPDEWLSRRSTPNS